MSQTPNGGRVRRTERYAKPEDVSPQKAKRQPQPKPPIGRSAELQARMRENAQERQMPLYSDFEPTVVSTQRSQARYPSKKRRKQSHNGLWLAVALICLILSGALVVFVAPQLMNLELGDMSSFAFVNRSMIIRDQGRIDSLEACRETLQSSRIHQGVFIDGVHVGGMTREEAVQAVNAVPSSAGGQFDLRVSIDGQTWSINSDVVPLYRNTEEVVLKAYAVGRSNVVTNRASVTPLQQRLDVVQDVAAQPVGLWTETTYDHRAVREIVDSIALSVNREPINAAVDTFDVSTKRFTFTDHTDGQWVDADAIYNEITARLDSGMTGGTLHVAPQVVLAPVTKVELMNGFGRVSTFTTKKTGNTNRTTNIDLSAKAINGVTVLPGETFSFNRATGERTAEKGYKPAAAISGGETFDEIGGGVCQTSSTLFNAVVRADLEIISRKPHAWPSDYVDRGEDATVNWPNLDFKFRNNTEYPVFIVSWCDKSAKTVTVEIYGKLLADGMTIDLDSVTTYTDRPPETTKYVYNPSLPYGTEKQTVKARTGYTVVTDKVYKRNGQEVSRTELHTSHYKMYQKTVEHNKPDVYGTAEVSY